MTAIYELPGGITTSCACPYCGTPFVPSNRTQVTCGKPACRSKRNVAIKTIRYRSEPGFAEKARERWRAWHERHGASRSKHAIGRRDQAPRPQPVEVPVSRIDPWTLAAPAFDRHLPGGLLEVAFNPSPNRALPQEQLRALHGLLSRVLGKPHDPARPNVSLLAWRSRAGWSAYFHDRDDARRLAGTGHDGRLFNRRIRLELGPLLMLRTPAAPEPGRYFVTLDAITPVVIRATGKRKTTVRTSPTSGSLSGSLVSLARRRLGLALEERDVPVIVHGQSTEQRVVDVGGHWGGLDDDGPGRIRGWVGHVTVETNAVGAWLIACAERLGLGRGSSLGFGRVVVRTSP